MLVDLASLLSSLSTAWYSAEIPVDSARLYSAAMEVLVSDLLSVHVIIPSLLISLWIFPWRLNSLPGLLRPDAVPSDAPPLD